jgi:SAM-dependent methyltransferase
MYIQRELCFQISKRMVLSRKTGAAGQNAATFDSSAYQTWRQSELKSQFTSNFSRKDIEDKDILDFGCGEGDLSFLMCDLGAKTVTGMDLSKIQIESAQLRAGKSLAGVRPDFRLAGRSDHIDLPAESIDVILCFDVLEHILDYEVIIKEWNRILRKDGKILIWWVPWFHPFGPHIESLVPIPWAHVFFSEKAILDTCSRIYSMSEFKPRIWDLDEMGKKKPNKWPMLNRLPEVNKLTMRQFESLILKSGLKVQMVKLRGFGSSSLAKITRVLLRVPFLKEFFTSSVVYRIIKH